MAKQFNDTKEQVAERLKRLIANKRLVSDDFLEYAKQFYPITVKAYRQWQRSCETLDAAMSEEMHDKNDQNSNTNITSEIKRVKIRPGSKVTQNFCYGTWPFTASGEKIDTNMVFEAKWNGDYWNCIADGFGMLKLKNQSGEYGNGAIAAFGLDSVEIID